VGTRKTIGGLLQESAMAMKADAYLFLHFVKVAQALPATKIGAMVLCKYHTESLGPEERRIGDNFDCVREKAILCSITATQIRQGQDCNTSCISGPLGDILPSFRSRYSTTGRQCFAL
jgi:hypothetical protein